jgi:hypothetical protein
MLGYGYAGILEENVLEPLLKGNKMTEVAVNKVICIGGPHDGQVKDVAANLVSPMNPEPAKIPVITDTGLIKNYLVVFISGNTLHFPIAVWEDITPDDVFKALLNWYAAKPRVRRIDPTEAGSN